MGFNIKIIILMITVSLKIIFKSLLKIVWFLSVNLIFLIFYFSIYVIENCPNLNFNKVLFNIFSVKDILTKINFNLNIFTYIIFPTILTSLIFLLINENVRKNYINNKDFILSIKKTKNKRAITFFERSRDYILKFSLFKKVLTFKIKRKTILFILVLINLILICFCLITSAKNLKIYSKLKIEILNKLNF